MKKPFSPQEFREIYSRVPRISVDLVIEIDGGVLFVKRALDSYKGQWHLPGGTVFYKESIEVAARRIAKEEVGLDITLKQLLGYIEYNSEEKERGFGYTVGLVFSCENVKGEILLNSEGSDVKLHKTIPKNTIIDQKEFLDSINLLAMN